MDANSSTEVECAICTDFLLHPLTLECGHGFCRSCLLKVAHHAIGSKKCPLCRRCITCDLEAHPVDERLERLVKMRIGPVVYATMQAGARTSVGQDDARPEAGPERASTGFVGWASRWMRHVREVNGAY